MMDRTVAVPYIAATPAPEERSVVVTGAAGFIGYHTCRRLRADGWTVTGVDNFDSYYDTDLKRARVSELHALGGVRVATADICDADAMGRIFHDSAPSTVVHLAGQAGVRHSLDHPGAYVQANLVGFATVLELCREREVDHLVYASSSSVYGELSALPFADARPADHPCSLYAATKRANELMAHSYSHLFGLPTTGLRFFSVYGEWGRPDMAYFLFTRAIMDGRPVTVLGDGTAIRDFTHVDDIVESIRRLTLQPTKRDDAWHVEDPRYNTSTAPWRVMNVGYGSTCRVDALVDLLEQVIGRRAIRRYSREALGDVTATHADTSFLASTTGHQPGVDLETGMSRFVDWFRREGLGQPWGWGR